MFYPWLLLTFLLSNPIVAGAVLLGIWLLADRAWFRRTSPWRWVRMRQSIAKLRTRLDVNPHDRDARFQLAELLVERGENDEAAALVSKNVEAGDADAETFWLAGKAAYGSSRADASTLGELYLSKAEEQRASFRGGAIDLERGRGRLAHARYREAREALERAIVARPGSVQAHVLLARAHAGAGDLEASATARRKAWQLYREAPRFKRRQDRTWAWKAKPSAAVAHYGMVSCVVGVLVVFVPKLAPSNEVDLAEEMEAQPEEGWNVPARDDAPASRFTVTPSAAVHSEAGGLPRWDLNDNSLVDLRRKLFAGDLWCRIVTHYPGVADDFHDQRFIVEDTQSGATFGIEPLSLAYFSMERQGNAGNSGADSAAWKDSVLAFESLLEAEPPTDCEATIAVEGSTRSIGVRDGKVFDVVRW